MASPVIASAATSSTNTAGTNHVVTLPSGIAAGDLILVLMNVGTRPTTVTLNAHADYTELLDEDLSGGLKILYRWAAGGESNPTFVSSGTTRDATITYRITGAENPATQAPEIGTTAASTDPPTVTPTGGSKDYLFIAMVGATGEQADDGTFCTAFPTNYTESPQEKTCGVAGTNLGGMIAAAGFRTTASSGNPSAFTVSDTGNRSQTIAVHPVSSTPATATPATVEVAADVPAPTILATAKTEPTAIAALADVPAVTFLESFPGQAGLIWLFLPEPVGGDATVTATVIAATVSVPAPTVLAAAIGTPATIAATVSLPAPTIQGQGRPTPATVAVAAAVQAPTVQGSARPTPSTVAATVSLPAPTIRGTAVVQPTTIGVTVEVIAPTILAEGDDNVTVTPAAIAVSAAVGAPTVSGTTVVTPATIAIAASVPAPTILATARVTPSTVAVTSLVGTPVLRSDRTATPTTITVSITLPAPTLRGTAVMSPDTVQVIAAVGVPFIPVEGAAPPVEEPKAVLVGVEGTARSLGTEGTAILVEV